MAIKIHGGFSHNLYSGFSHNLYSGLFERTKNISDAFSERIEKKPREVIQRYISKVAPKKDNFFDQLHYNVTKRKARHLGAQVAILHQEFHDKVNRIIEGYGNKNESNRRYFGEVTRPSGRMATF